MTMRRRLPTMRRRAALAASLAAILALPPAAPALAGQGSAPGAAPTREAAPFFRREEPVELTITANMGRLRRDKQDGAPWRAATIALAPAEGAPPVAVPARVRTRGLWRLKNCALPPLRVDFRKKDVQGTPLEGLDRPKLANVCSDSDEGDRYLLREVQLYRIWALLSPMAHRARLVRARYADSAGGKEVARRWAILIDEPEAMAKRTGTTLVELKGARADDLVPRHTALLGLFQYMIGNTDFSISGLHNVELLRDVEGHVPVPYDFDWSGAVEARYAAPDARLPIKRVRDRLYRGLCVPPDELAAAIAVFNERRDAIAALYRAPDPVGALLPPEEAKRALDYFDEFYRTINDPAQRKRQIEGGCVK